MAQKHTIIRDSRKLLWYTEGLWEKCKGLVPFELEISSIKEVDQNCWFGSREPTLREVAKHVGRIRTAELIYPIILNEDGSLMDGGHRICKALLDGQTKIMAVQFDKMPKPDEVTNIND
ncbi:MAG: hypothetical protein JKY88_11230 [Pseudomonadales bacterium]|nr:hypothetical protein [Pseudomonadales bacterium]